MDEWIEGWEMVQQVRGPNQWWSIGSSHGQATELTPLVPKLSASSTPSLDFLPSLHDLMMFPVDFGGDCLEQHVHTYLFLSSRLPPGAPFSSSTLVESESRLCRGPRTWPLGWMLPSEKKKKNDVPLSLAATHLKERRGTQNTGPRKKGKKGNQKTNIEKGGKKKKMAMAKQQKKKGKGREVKWKRTERRKIEKKNNSNRLYQG